MGDVLDMSLDDIIQKNKKSGGENRSTYRASRGRGRGGARGPHDSSGPSRHFPNHAKARTAPYFTPQAVHMMQDFVESGTKLYISNLDYGVTNDDIKVLFSEVGELKRYSVHYDSNGRSKGTAEVEFARQADAFAAVRRYNNVRLDGKSMKTEIVGLKLVTPAAITMPPTSRGILGHPGGAFRRQERVAWDRGSGGRGSVGGRGRGRGRGEKKMSTEDLDADLDKYHKQAVMEIN